jgi:outer membrane lipoprotein-sorting protein
MAHFQDTAACPYPHPRFRSGRPLRLTLCFTLVALLTGIRPAQAQDGRPILLKALKFYQTLNSYSGQSNVDTMMIAPNGQTIKHIGSSSAMKLQRPNKIYLFFQTPIGSRSIYSDGVNFSVYDATPNQYLTIPTAVDMTGLLKILLERADVAAGLDPLYFLTKASLPKELTNVKIKSTTVYNGHPVYLITGTTNATPVVIRTSKTITTIPPSYWTWWIDRNSSLLYKIETITPNVVKPVSFGTGVARTIKNIKGTLLIRHTVSQLKPDTNLRPDEFVFIRPKTAVEKKRLQDVLPQGGK